MRYLNCWDNKNFWGAKFGPLTHAWAVKGICEKFHLSHISFYNIYISKFYAQIFDYLSCSNNIRMTSEFFNKNKFQFLLLLLKLRSKQPKNEISTGFCSVANWNNELNERKKKMKNSVMFAHCCMWSSSKLLRN